MCYCLRAFLALLGALLVGCATGLTPESTAMRVLPPSGATPKIQITVIENRPYVLRGSQGERFEGLTRELYGIPISRDTNDGATMAAYLGERLRIGFARAGYVSSYSPSQKGMSVRQAVGRIEAATDTLIFLVDMRDWRYDMGGFRPSFKYDITVSVFTGIGKLLSEETFGGVERMPGGGWKHFKVRYAELYQTIFDQIFATSNIRAGLAGRATTSGKGSSPEQRLTRLKDMLDDGLITREDFEEQKKRVLGEL